MEHAKRREIKKVDCPWMKSPIRLKRTPHFVSFVCFVGQKICKQQLRGGYIFPRFWHVGPPGRLILWIACAKIVTALLHNG
jgi:hypothetical protein